MSVPMEISVQETTGVDTSVQNGGVPEPVAPRTVVAEDKFLVSFEVCLKASSAAQIHDVQSAVERMLEKRSLSYIDGPIAVPLDEPILVDNGQRISICDTEEWVENHDIILFWQFKPPVHVFKLSEEGPCEDLSGDGQLSTFSEWMLPAKEFDGMWESLIYEPGLEQRSLRYAASALLLPKRVLIHSLYRGTASFFYMDLQGQARRLYARQWLRNYPSVLAPGTRSASWLRSMFILCSVNGFPKVANCDMNLGTLRGGDHLIIPNYASLNDKLTTAVSEDHQPSLSLCKQLLVAAEACEGLSGRSLRKLPFLAHAALANPYCNDPGKFVSTMIETVRREQSAYLIEST